jgi:4-amino-4-deoxy-L-arabinose transferase-like glycosyltransferase
MATRLQSVRARLQSRAGLGAIAALAVGWVLLIHAIGWGQLASYAQVRSLADGRAEIDRWHWQTKDKAWVNGHFYSVKAPGLALVTLPAYLGLDAAGAQGAADGAARNASRAEHPRWRPFNEPPYSEHGYSAARAARVGTQIERATPMVWALALVGAVVPALLMLLLVRSLGDRISPGFGAAAAITLGVATMVMTFASEYFPHVIAAMLGFAAFALLFRERRGPPRTALVGAAGLLAGLAVPFEYPLGLVGVVLFCYALTGSRPRLPRGAAYAAGAVLGALPVLVFNQWAFGSPFEFAYGNAVAVQGLDGHAVLGLNDNGFFGISVPDPGAAVDLLLSGRGLLTITPIVAMGVAGALAMRRGRYRAEANVVLAVAAVYLLYNAGYWLPFGGGTPGPRFLIPALPFLALGLAVAWRRWPAQTLALAIPSAVFMLAAAMTHPLIGEATATWAERLDAGQLEHTLLTALGVRDGWLAAVPVLAAVAAAVVLAVLATPRARRGEVRGALALLAGWAALSVLGPSVAGDAATPLAGGGGTLVLIAIGAAGAALALGALRYRELRAPSGEPAVAVPAPALAPGERIS